ncbi:MAG: response regulator [Sulfuricurvum sp.]|nr:response regulator [Sulfuricurvum sp.]
MPTILVIDDDTAIRKLLGVALNAAGFTTILTDKGINGLAQAATHNPSLILLDLGLPDIEGRHLLQKLREWSNTPVIVLSAREAEHEKIMALEAGADDYLTKPFSVGELIARIKSCLRRVDMLTPSSNPIIISDNLHLNALSHTVTLSNIPLKLTPKEFELLRLLMQNSGKVLTHTWLLKEIWGIVYQSETHYLRVFINQLRQKIEVDPARPKRIITETGIGYRFMG